ncbi:flagellar hook-length control protein FliK [Thiocystis violacea]|uniref:flagellar hook-length control protein FliK n=1 Tax=Thiocystis violacea TaxID=13725 RepID=UPI00190766D9|nr:flagellar hook-length control protein FliK [Thiocystis violacea]MBK1723681.1 hypothetical protein [Thiocystis violacea]
MSEPLAPIPPGQASAPSLTAPGLRETAAARPALADGLRAGMRIEIQPSRQLSAQVLEVRIRGMDVSQTWSAPTQARLVTPLPNPLSQQLASGSSPASLDATRLQAEVVAVKPALVLRLLSPESPQTAQTGATPPPGTRAWLGQQLRQHWPESRLLAPTLQTLVDRLGAPGETARALPGPDAAMKASVQQSVATLVDRLSAHSDLTDPDRLSSALAKSGLWLESTLAQAITNPSLGAALGQDLKAQLLALAHQIRDANRTEQRSERREPSARTAARLDAPTGSQGTPQGRPALPQTPPAPPTQHAASTLAQQAAGAEGQASTRLLTATANQPPPQEDAQTPAPRGSATSLTAGLAREVDGMIKQIVTHQLQALDTTPAQPHWVLEMPFRTPTGLITLEADIQREQAADASEEGWSMQIHLDLPRLGALTITLKLRAEQLNASLQAGTELGAATLKQNLSTLRAQLEAREIQVASLHAGFRPSARRPPPFDAPLVSEEA